MENFNAFFNILIVAVLSYLAGSIPTSIIASKLFKGIDIRDYGSGNAGASNAFRVLGWKIGFMVVVIDIFKGFAAAYWISRIALFNTSVNTADIAPVIAGGAAIFGHCFTVFANFKGGKGIATSAGMLIAIEPVTFFVCLLVFLAVLTTTGYVSLGSLMTAAVFPVTVMVLNFLEPGSVSLPFTIVSFIASIFVFYTHRSNIKRLLQGKENRFNRVRIFARK